MSLRSQGAVLVLEDEPVIADVIVQYLASADFLPLGPFDQRAAAYALLDAITPDVAILDTGLRGGHCFSVADILRARSVPCIFTSGNDEAALPSRFAGLPLLRKPYDYRDLLAAVTGSAQCRIGWNWDDDVGRAEAGQVDTTASGAEDRGR